MSGLRARLAEVLEEYGAYSAAMALCLDPALARALEDAELFRALQRKAYEGEGVWTIILVMPEKRSTFRAAAIDAARNRHD